MKFALFLLAIPVSAGTNKRMNYRSAILASKSYMARKINIHATNILH